jgi:hypothetical protein
MKFLKVEPKGANAVLLTEESVDFPNSNLETAQVLATWPEIVSQVLSKAAQTAVIKNPKLLEEIKEDPELMYTIGVGSESGGNVKVAFKIWAPRRP